MKKIFILVLLALGFPASSYNYCEKKYSDEEIKIESEKANSFFEKVFNEYVDRHPMCQSSLGIKKDYDKWDDISDVHEIMEMNILKLNITTLKNTLNYDALDNQTKLSYRLYEYNATLKIEGFKYRFYNYPVNQVFGLHAEASSFLINIHQVNDDKDAKDYLSRLSKINILFDQLISNIALRSQKGITPPKFVFKSVIQDCKNILKGAPFEKTSVKSVLLEDFSKKINALTNISNSDKAALIKEAGIILLTSVGPAYQRLISYLEKLEKRASTDEGAWKFPNGEDFYRYALKYNTTTNLTPDEIFDMGLREVDRIKSQIECIKAKVNFKGDIGAFFEFIKNDKQFYYPNTSSGRKAYLHRTIQLVENIECKLDELFITKPKADLIVKPVEDFREESVPVAFYQEPAPNGIRPGIYYVNLHDMAAISQYEMEALTYHETIPGHHMQIAISQELADIPSFRKYGSYLAYVEGWGLYSEYIPKEIGFYQDPYSDFGRLSLELWRACRLVVDVGIHYKKWTRQQAINYLVENTPNSLTDCIKEVERYIVLPGQATTYKIGMLKILELREKAKKELGSSFDLREYHELILTQGSLPLNILEEIVKDWIRRKIN
ncbi:MAG: DUF885 domain-containing protein [Cytophagaceae bacterium]|nr:DUF885 domain-containing protein [Cytophagaceae bacterium]